jgi:hypothetical protein
MREIIRFGWGICSLGDFMVAMSGKGLVALEFSTNHSATEDALLVRFPEASVPSRFANGLDYLGTVRVPMPREVKHRKLFKLAELLQEEHHRLCGVGQIGLPL